MRHFDKPLSVISNASGLITALSIHNGDYVSEGDILATVTEPSSLILVVNVPFEYTRQIHIGTPCEVIFSDHRKMNLSINGILPTVDATSQTQSYYIRLPDQHLPENLNVTLNLMTQKSSEKSLTIPVSALQTDELEKEFWVMKIRQGIAYKTPVVPGSQNTELVEIKGGQLTFGDSIVTEGSYQLEDSSLVSVPQ
jgi:multidrug efflux pump subunit AcrA (membrane-fusion protein)